MSWISGFVFGPFYAVIVYAIVRRRDWIRIPALLYVGAMLYSMIVHIALELMWDVPPPSLAALSAIYAPYVIAPLLLAWRVRGPHPFSRVSS